MFSSELSAEQNLQALVQEGGAEKEVSVGMELDDDSTDAQTEAGGDAEETEEEEEDE